MFGNSALAPNTKLTPEIKQNYFVKFFDSIYFSAFYVVMVADNVDNVYSQLPTTKKSHNDRS